LQEHFNAVVHYDLPWNPTRLEQREGRVDRYGQPSPAVKVATIFGVDNVIDEIVLDVLLRKHKLIRSELGVSIPVPGSNDEFIETIFERLFTPANRQLSLLAEPVREVQQTLFEEWDRAADKEKRSRTRFAQHAISTDEVARELAEAKRSIGSATDVARFVGDAVRALGGSKEGDGTTATGPPATLSLDRLPRGARDLLGAEAESSTLVVRYQPILHPHETYLARTHPLVAGLAGYVLDAALDAHTESPAGRCGAIRTSAVTTTTTLILLRLRFDISISRRGAHGGPEAVEQLLAEDLVLAAFEGPPASPHWLDPVVAEHLLSAQPTGNISHEQRSGFVARIVESAALLTPALDDLARARAGELVATHRRVRKESSAGGRIMVTAHVPVDVLGTYLYLPA
ncbi:MAG: hypothetical protein ACRDWB_08340, partial [Acidimicrobiales bacterium]